jgi:hypothetical protein
MTPSSQLAKGKDTGRAAVPLAAFGVAVILDVAAFVLGLLFDSSDDKTAWFWLSAVAVVGTGIVGLVLLADPRTRPHGVAVVGGAAVAAVVLAVFLFFVIGSQVS